MPRGCPSQDSVSSLSPSTGPDHLLSAHFLSCCSWLERWPVENVILVSPPYDAKAMGKYGHTEKT